MLCRICHERPVRSNVRYRLCDVCRDKYYRYNLGKQCPVCQVAILNWSTYCPQHAQAYRSVIKLLTCEYCGKEFTQKKRPYNRFCSRSCAARSLYANNESKMADRFWTLVDKRGDDECWEWKGCRTKDGYGYFHVRPHTNATANRVSYRLAHGDFPKELKVLHTCDNPPCVNPKHLFLGTDLDNNQDMVAKGRDYHPSGETHPRAKLTPSDIASIRDSYPALSLRFLARQYGVSKTHIRRIVRHQSWRHSTS